MAEVAEELIWLGSQPLWSWGFSTLDREAPVPIGSLVYVLGATGRGKSSFLAQIASQHARSAGPVVVVSAELTGAIFGARLVSQTRVATWIDVVRGSVDPETVRGTLATLAKMRLMDRVAATWASDLRGEILALQADYPGETVLVALDYLQILRAEGREVRERVLGASTILRELAKETGAVIVAVAKMSRGASRAARDGSNLGVQGTEGGAEAGIELDAVVQMSLGFMKPEDETQPQGAQIVDVSINKTRFGAADRIVPFRFVGAHGTFEDLHQAVPAAARRREGIAAQRSASFETRIREVLAGVVEPITVNALAGKEFLGGKRANTLKAISTAVASGLLVQIEFSETEDRRSKLVMLGTTARERGYKSPPSGSPNGLWSRP